VGVVTATEAACVLQVLALVTEVMGFVLSIKKEKKKLGQNSIGIWLQWTSFHITVSSHNWIFLRSLQKCV
jgi:hypothetical protein